MLKSLDRKLLRGAWHMRGQVLAIAMIVAAAVASFVLALTALRSLSEARDAYYERYRFAHVFVQLKRAPESVAERVRDLPSVVRVDSRIEELATIDMPDAVEPVRGVFVSLPPSGEPRLNALYLRNGRAPDADRSDEVVVHEAFAQAYGLKPHDKITAILNGKRRVLTIVGIALSPEFIYVIGPGELVPDNRRFGIFWMGRKALAAAFDFEDAFNSLALQIERGTPAAEVIDDVDRMLAPYGARGAVAREDHPSHAFIDSELNQLRTMAAVIPPIFLLVSAFLLHNVIARLIQTEREQIGLLKAFGYFDGEVGWHYVKFALIIVAIGLVVGWTAGAWFGRAITEMYAEYFRFPYLPYAAAPDIFLLAGLLGGATAISGTLAAIRSALRLAPAVAMAAPLPTVYRQTLLERLGMSAGVTSMGLMIVRHIARWPARAGFTVSGIALAIALLIATTQFLDAIDVMIETFFFRSQKQDVTLQFVERRNDGVAHDVKRLPGVVRVELRRIAAVRLRNGHLSERTAILGVDPGAQLTQLVDARDRAVFLPPSGLVLGDHLAKLLGARQGDRLQIEFLEEEREPATIAVVRIVSEFVGSTAYMNRAALNRLMGTPDVADGALLESDELASAGLSRALKDAPAVASTIFNKSTVIMFRELIDKHLVNMLLVYILFASIIAVGVTYNSSRITLSERAGELATLRVLGAHKREVAAILIGEIALLTVAALPVGCVLGYWLSFMIVSLFTTDLYRMPFAIENSTYANAVIAISIATALSCGFVAWRVHRLDLVRVLKARD